MTALYCSRHQTGWNSPPALCPVCQDDEAKGGKRAHQDRTPQEEADYQHNSDDTPRINYASSCGTGALVVEAKKIERELAALRNSFSDVTKERDALLPVYSKVDELLSAIELAEADVGHRPINDIIGELGPLWSAAEDALREAPK